MEISLVVFTVVDEAEAINWTILGQLDSVISFRSDTIRAGDLPGPISCCQAA